ncbi:glycosyltransferase [Lacticaseibacillus suilingensis]|jgi:accessory Sec system glycosylation protein GtfA|uniref:Glycosyltransferase n=1 Tax=Lacticaseibacillus suilingensis TaxID=2799577 RepID=A0ABW4BI36_9LACO|nr:glycosyltransferase [Lacticaseibacillus suilingensis]MCI1894880.1 glycosyltransferase [Lactobacillus sp.]MCI1917220.1 glycosyltransferase [Lactobacillus sp.]MCI1973125.1 glycosyltransferase [Lactobacillus sp.]MCI2016664.1 glycosyltransferase [Lactobacillus sp.]
MNFFVNDAMGMGNSGVEHAQFYRAKRFDQAKLPYRYIFLDLIPELHKAMDRWELRDDQVINIWEFFTLGDDYALTGLKQRITAKKADIVIDGTDTHRKSEEVLDSGLRVVNHLVKYPDIHKPENKLLMVSAGRTEIFNEATGKRAIMYEYVDDPHRNRLVRNIHIFDYNGKHLFFPNRVLMYRFFFNRLNDLYGAPSTFLIDRGEEVDEALMNQPIPEAKLVYVVHADTLGDRNDKRYPLWNNHYQYMFDHIQSSDRIVVATELQRQDILVDFPDVADKVVAIPVGGVRDGIKPRERAKMQDPIRVITASRLAAEKHVDLAIKAVAKWHDEDGVNVEFDIYGRGEEQKKLEDAIKETNSGDYIKLKGLSDNLAEIYPQYDIFVSASFSEGFGLTYIEALNASLPIVTYRARFGATELVHDGENGFLADFKRDDMDYDVDTLHEGFKRLQAANYGKLVANTTASLDQFQDHVIAGKWQKLMEGLR